MDEINNIMCSVTEYDLFLCCKRNRNPISISLICDLIRDDDDKEESLPTEIATETTQIPRLAMEMKSGAIPHDRESAKKKKKKKKRRKSNTENKAKSK